MTPNRLAKIRSNALCWKQSDVLNSPPFPCPGYREALELIDEIDRLTKDRNEWRDRYNAETWERR
jgi:hypothetical protein